MFLVLDLDLILLIKQGLIGELGALKNQNVITVKRGNGYLVGKKKKSWSHICQA